MKRTLFLLALSFVCSLGLGAREQGSYDQDVKTKKTIRPDEMQFQEQTFKMYGTKNDGGSFDWSTWRRVGDDEQVDPAP